MGLFKIIHESYSLSLAIFGYKQKKKRIDGKMADVWREEWVVK